MGNEGPVKVAWTTRGLSGGGGAAVAWVGKAMGAVHGDVVTGGAVAWVGKAMGAVHGDVLTGW